MPTITLRKIILLLAIPAIVFACSPSKKDAKNPFPNTIGLSATPQRTLLLAKTIPFRMTFLSPTPTPRLSLITKTKFLLRSTHTPTRTATPTAVPTIDDFFARCPTAQEIAAVNQSLTLTFETDPTAGTLVCTASTGSADLTALQKRAYQSVLIMKYLSFDAPLPWTNNNLYDWFVGTIHGIRFRADIANSYCCEPANTINIEVASNTYLVLTDHWLDPSIAGGLMDAMVLFIHEARHNNGYPHTCNNGADDKTIAELGSWGVQYYILQWLAQHGDRGFLKAPGGAPNLYRQMALNDSLAIQRACFCNEPTATPGASPTLAP
ncbi:MAG: hypothetical protein WBM17_12910 [Anaerolineales bacterium]